MSKNTQVADEVFEDDIDETKIDQGSSHVFLKILSILLLAGIVAGFFAPVYFTLIDSTFTVHTNGSILGGDLSLFGLMMEEFQAFLDGSEQTVGLFFRMLWLNKYVFGIAITAVLLLITTIITLCTKKAAPVWFRIDCVLIMIVFAFYGGNILADGVLQFDIVMITGVVALLFMIIHGFSKGAKGVAPTLSFIAIAAALVLTAYYSFFGTEEVFCISAAGYFFNIMHNVLNLIVDGTEFVAPVVETYQLVAYITFALLVVNLILTAFQMGFIKSNWFTFLRYLAQVGLCVATIVMIAMNIETDDVFGLLLPSILVGVCALLMLLFTVIAMAAGRKKTDEEEDEEASAETESMDAIAQGGQPVPAYSQPAPAYGQPYGQPYGQSGQPMQPYYQPAPNVYINITPGGAVTASTTAPAEARPAQETQTAPVVISAPVKEAPAAPAAPVKAAPAAKPVVVQAEETVETEDAEIAEEPKEKPAKKRSFCVFLSLVLAIASVALFVVQYLDVLKDLFTGFSVDTLSDTAFLLPCGFFLGVLIGFICSLVALIKPSKVGAFFTFLFFALGGAACFAYIQLNQGGIVEAFTDMTWLTIASMVCIVLSVLFAFIGIFRTRGVKKEEEYEEEEDEGEEEVVPEKATKEKTVSAKKATEEPAAAAVAPAPAPAEVAPAEAAPAATEAAPAPATAETEPEEEEETDAFLRTLSPAEKREFNRVFLQGKAPAYLPAYKTGADNSRFFDSIFVYLGKMRSVISDNLLGKIYDFMMENK